jgi:hypothetical protein
VPGVAVLLDLDQASDLNDSSCCYRGEVPVSDPTDVIMQAIRSAFESYPKEGDPDWRNPSWIMLEECASLSQGGSWKPEASRS